MSNKDLDALRRNVWEKHGRLECLHSRINSLKQAVLRVDAEYVRACDRLHVMEDMMEEANVN